MPRSPALDPAHSRNCRAESPSRSILETSAPPNSASLNWSAQSGTQSEGASSATLARAALCACRSCPSPHAASARGETPRLSGAETSATPDVDVGRDIHQSPCHPTHSVPQTGWWCRCACNRASSYRTGLSSTAAPAASDLTLVFGSFHTHSTKALSGGFIYNPTTSVSFSRNFASRDSLKVRLRCGLILCSCHKRFTVFLLTPCAFAISRQLQWVMPLGLLCKVA